jgi:DUF1680 family protein
MKNFKFIVIAILLFMQSSIVFSQNSNSDTRILQNVNDVKIEDAFWKPKMELWRKITVNDVFDKFEGKYELQRQELTSSEKKLGRKTNAFLNFDAVADGKRGTELHDGPPWYDGLIYESIRGASDFLTHYPDVELEKRIDGYINRIAAAQATDPNGYLDTYTQLVEPDHMWGENGGNLRWQHDVYNAGLLSEAAVHYYNATGKTKLLDVAVKLANYMYAYMGPFPKHNVVPAHSGPEEALVKLYWIFKNNPELKGKVSVPVNEENYFDLAKFWIEAKGHSDGFPAELEACGNPGCTNDYENSKYFSRKNFGAYSQDSIPFFQQKTIEGHAVRATLFATGATTIAIENKDSRYIKSISSLWDNMVGKRMFISGGVGAIAEDEKFGHDYYLPTDAYLETCAAVGAGFFSQRMNQLVGQGEYIDELERVLFNSVLTEVSLTGDLYTYQNPLNAEGRYRWNWHGCPCCPPMFLKMVSSIPDFIYSTRDNEVFVNLFIGSEAKIKLENNTKVDLKQTTNYPWDGKISIKMTLDSESNFFLKLRIPGWARSTENPFGLYQSKVKSDVVIRINGKPVPVETFNGYVTIRRTWKADDEVELVLPMEPRFVYAHNEVKVLNGLVAIAAGPILYCLEGNSNDKLDDLKIDTNEEMKVVYKSDLLNGVNVIEGKGIIGNSQMVEFKAIPYYDNGNIKSGDKYKVWMPMKK